MAKKVDLTGSHVPQKCLSPLHYAGFSDFPVIAAALHLLALLILPSFLRPPKIVSDLSSSPQLLLSDVSLSPTTPSFHPESNMRLRSSPADASDGSQLFEDTSGAAPAAQTGYRWGPDLRLGVKPSCRQSLIQKWHFTRTQY